MASRNKQKHKEQRLSQALRLFRHDKPALVLRNGRIKLALPKRIKVKPEEAIAAESIAQQQYRADSNELYVSVTDVTGKVHYVTFNPNL